MKKLIFLFLFAITLFSSCKKEDDCLVEPTTPLTGEAYRVNITIQGQRQGWEYLDYTLFGYRFIIPPPTISDSFLIDSGDEVKITTGSLSISATSAEVSNIRVYITRISDNVLVFDEMIHGVRNIYSFYQDSVTFVAP